MWIIEAKCNEVVYVTPPLRSPANPPPPDSHSHLSLVVHGVGEGNAPNNSNVTAASQWEGGTSHRALLRPMGPLVGRWKKKKKNRIRFATRAPAGQFASPPRAAARQSFSGRLCVVRTLANSFHRVCRHRLVKASLSPSFYTFVVSCDPLSHASNTSQARHGCSKKKKRKMKENT